MVGHLVFVFQVETGPPTSPVHERHTLRIRKSEKVSSRTVNASYIKYCAIQSDPDLMAYIYSLMWVSGPFLICQTFNTKLPTSGDTE